MTMKGPAMDMLLQSIESKTYQLCVWDFVASFCNMPFSFYFKATNGSGFMPTELLYTSLLRALQEFPILLGRLVVSNKTGRGYVIVDREALNMPDFQESQSTVHYDEMEAANFSWDALDMKMATVEATPAKNAISGDIKLVNVHVVRLRDDSGVIVFANIPHYVMDGFGYTAFVNRWAEVCKWLYEGVGLPDIPLRRFNFDRTAIEKALPDKTEPLSAASTRLYGQDTVLARTLGRLTPKTRGALLSTVNGFIPARGHVFHIAKDTLDRIRVLINTKELRCSDNDILTALVSHVVGRAIKDGGLAGGSLFMRGMRAVSRLLAGGESDELLTLVVADIRPRLEQLCQAHYVGGGITGYPVYNKVDLVAQADSCTRSLQETCGNIRQAVNMLTPKYIRSTDSALGHSPSSFANVLSQCIIAYKKIVITNQSRFPMYATDFGGGTPQWVGPGMPNYITNFAFVLPRRPNTTGYDVYLSLEEPLMKGVLRNGFWSTCTSFIH
ncbi:hypothetical protein GGF46_001815 [Coemansia sp. RSA 552]|nr:hypothetical protein GGF46_001815 [Coemansia sp. RSA 552]